MPRLERGRVAFDRAKPRFMDALSAIHGHLTYDVDTVGDALADLSRAADAALSEARDRELIARKAAS